jgi:hypothetical protein
MEKEELHLLTRGELEDMVLDLQKDNAYLKERINTVLDNVFPKK